jgi:uncharacterized protein
LCIDLGASYRTIELNKPQGKTRMPKQTLQALPDTFVIHSLPDDAAIPSSVFSAPVYFIGKTSEELSIVVPDTIEVESDDSDSGWRALEILGPLSLSMVGIMAQIGSVLAAAKISIFVVSTFETDFFLVKQQDLQKAATALTADGYKVNL